MNINLLHKYHISGDPINPVWPAIIQAVADNLSWFTERGIKPTLRAMLYRLYSLGLIANTHNNYTDLSTETAIARRGYEWDDNSHTWRKCTKYPKLDIDCFIDESRQKLDNGYNDERATDPEPPHKYINRWIKWLKEAPDEYCSENDTSRGKPPGLWYPQEYYIECWTEKQTLGPTFKNFLVDKKVVIVPQCYMFFHDNCMRLKQKQQEYFFLHTLTCQIIE